ncbi:MAG: amino acid ABC transporter permease [Chloroflexi bacterium]|nr:amino acid ABC transporter permease [Chloroflexota bacterium]|tara:strand:- start:2608 stop:3771 length:1164 start_codon:yes stop_codon:yes gene_type:complete
MTKNFIKWFFSTFFGSIFNSIVTILSALIFIFLINNIAGFISTSEWEVVTANRRLLLIGRMPEEHEWRIWSILWFTSFLIFSSINSWGPPSKKDLLLISSSIIIICLIFTTSSKILYVVISLLICGASYFTSHFISKSSNKKYFQNSLKILWLLLLPIIFTLLIIGGGPKPNLWGGFLLNIILAGIAIGFGFPLGILFALGRASSLPAIKTICTIYIETIRGAPLVGWLLLAWFVLPKFLPSFWGINEVSVVVRAMIVLTMFTSAYTAEVIRGGLQSIPKGQIEAADSLNLNYRTKILQIVLPQAIRVVVPALISTFIGVFKDTSLVFILALTDLLQVGRIIPEQDPEFFGKALEALCVVAFLFWIVSISLSNLSSKVEKSLGIGSR